MAHSNVTKQFSERLRHAMISAGFTSARSIYGASSKKLAEITGYSEQICRKYLRGEAMPELSKLMEIAKELKVSPGWLAFGELHSLNSSEALKDKVLISQESLRYIFMKVSSMKESQLAQDSFSNFLMELIDSINLIHGTEEQNKKIIDLAFISGNYFSPDS